MYVICTVLQVRGFVELKTYWCMCFYFVQFNSSGRTLDTDDTFLSRDCLEVQLQCEHWSCISVMTTATVTLELTMHWLQVLCYCMAISPTILETLQNSVDWRQFVQDILLLTRNRWDQCQSANVLSQYNGTDVNKGVYMNATTGWFECVQLTSSTTLSLSATLTLHF